MPTDPRTSPSIETVVGVMQQISDDADMLAATSSDASDKAKLRDISNNIQDVRYALTIISAVNDGIKTLQRPPAAAAAADDKTSTFRQLIQFANDQNRCNLSKIFSGASGTKPTKGRFFEIFCSDYSLMIEHPDAYGDDGREARRRYKRSSIISRIVNKLVLLKGGDALGVFAALQSQNCAFSALRKIPKDREQRVVDHALEALKAYPLHTIADDCTVIHFPALLSFLLQHKYEDVCQAIDLPTLGTANPDIAQELNRIASGTRNLEFENITPIEKRCKLLELETEWKRAINVPLSRLRMLSPAPPLAVAKTAFTPPQPAVTTRIDNAILAAPEGHGSILYCLSMSDGVDQLAHLSPLPPACEGADCTGVEIPASADRQAIATRLEQEHEEYWGLGQLLDDIAWVDENLGADMNDIF